MNKQAIVSESAPRPKPPVLQAPPARSAHRRRWSARRSRPAPSQWRSCRPTGLRRSHSPAARMPASRARSMRWRGRPGSRSRAGRRDARSRSTSSVCGAARCIADLPGYGYAAVPRALKKALAGFPLELRHDAHVAGRAGADRRRAPRIANDGRAAARGIPAVRAPGPDPRDQDRQAEPGRAQRAAVASIASRLTECFRARPGGQCRGVLGAVATGHRRSRRGDRAVDLLMSRRCSDEDKKEAPRSRGVTRGLETPPPASSRRGHPLREESGRR